MTGSTVSDPEPAGTFKLESRCDICGYVTLVPTDTGFDGQVVTSPFSCRSCRRPDATFTDTEVFYPARPSDEAIGRDTRAVEAVIREAYGRLTTGGGRGVMLADLRGVIPAVYDRETVDAALIKLCGHDDVSVTPHCDQKHVGFRHQRAALNTGVSQNHTLRIHSPRRTAGIVERVRLTTYVEAESILASLADDRVADVADQMGVDTEGGPAELRSRIAARSDANLRAWLADAEQGRLDGILLYRADHEPGWVATWTDGDRAAAGAAAARLLYRSATEESWRFVRDRAERWAVAVSPEAVA